MNHWYKEEIWNHIKQAWYSSTCLTCSFSKWGYLTEDNIFSSVSYLEWTDKRLHRVSGSVPWAVHTHTRWTGVCFVELYCCREQNNFFFLSFTFVALIHQLKHLQYLTNQVVVFWQLSYLDRVTRSVKTHSLKYPLGHRHRLRSGSNQAIKPRATASVICMSN